MSASNLFQRVVVAVIFIPLILFLVFRGGDFFLYFVLFLAAIGIYEYLKGGQLRAVQSVFIIPLIGAPALVYFIATGWLEAAFLCLLTVFLLTGIILAVSREPVVVLFDRLKYIIWGTVYIGTLFPFVYLVRGEAGWMEDAPGRWWVFLLLGSIWVCDSLAQFFGIRFGQRKLAPTVSPNKTIAGFLGGFVGSILVAVLFSLVWLKDVNPLHLFSMAMLIALFGQVGDLVESLWKRSIGIKDSSHIIPGHGGVLDRFDSLLFASPVVYLYLKYVLQMPWL